jgi:hypothetical protein
MQVLIELQYLPPLSAFAYFAQAERVTLEANEHFQKGSYRNRCHILGVNGPLRLSIPLVKGKHQQLPVREVEMAYPEPWPHQHWQSIRSAYGNAPFFPFYEAELAAIYRDPGTGLWDFNLRLFQCIIGFLQWEGDKFVHSTSYERVYLAGQDLRNQLRPQRFGSTQEAALFPAYPQVFADRHPFVANLSILDLLFCQGPQASLYLSKIKLHERDIFTE